MLGPLPLVYTAVFTAVYALLIVVLIMLVTGSLNIISRDIVHLPYLDILSPLAAVIISGISVYIYLRNIKEIYRYIAKIHNSDRMNRSR